MSKYSDKVSRRAVGQGLLRGLRREADSVAAESPGTSAGFRRIPSLGMLYEISEDGESLRRVGYRSSKKWYAHGRHGEAEYLRATVSVGGKRKWVYAHNLVAECWLGRKPPGMRVRHLNGMSTDNRAENLSYEPMLPGVRSKDREDSARKKASDIANKESIKEAAYAKPE